MEKFSKATKGSFAALAILVSMAMSGCISFGGGIPAGQAEVMVQGVPRSVLMSTAEDVFYRYGFNYMGGVPGRMEFEREAGPGERLLYGNWVGEDVSTRISLFILETEPDVYRLRSRAMVVRNVFGGDEDSKNFDVRGSRYGKLLKQIRDESMGLPQ